MMALRAVTVVILATVGQSAQDTPITKVVELIEEMKAKILADGKAEQTVYDKFACWCEKTLDRKATAIDTAQVEITRLKEKVLNIKGKAGASKAESLELMKDVTSTEEAIKEAADIRSKENRDYQSSREDLEQAIGALERAIGILTGAGEFTQKSKNMASALQETNFLSAADSVKGALRLVAPSHMRLFENIAEKDRQALEVFVGNPSQVFADLQAKSALLQAKSGSKGPTGDYAPASTAIQGILKGMYDSFTSDLETKNANEAITQKQYEQLRATKTAELASLKATFQNKANIMGDDAKSLADAQTDLDETIKVMTSDKTFFDDSKASCKNRAGVWSERSRMRTQELNGINKAIQILTSPESMATFGRANSMLLQVRYYSKQAPEDSATKAAKKAAFATLKDLAGKGRSLRLAALAAKVHMATKGHFDLVITQVDKMIEELRAEQKSDIDLRDWCQEEENKVANAIDDRTHEIKLTTELIERLNSEKQTLQEDVRQSEEDIKETEETMAEALSSRNAENEDFKSALKDDLDQVSLIGSAIDALSEFYKANKLPMGALLELKKQPEYAVDPDKMPEGPSEEPYGGASSQGGGIVSILGFLKEDTENEIKTTKAAEAKAQADYDTQRNAALAAVAALKAKIYNLELQVSETDEKIAEAGELNRTTEEQKVQSEQYKEDIKPKCEWIKGAFETRKDRRQNEMTGLMKAKSELAGGGDELIQKGKGAFLQKVKPNLFQYLEE